MFYVWTLEDGNDMPSGTVGKKRTYAAQNQKGQISRQHRLIARSFAIKEHSYKNSTYTVLEIFF